MSKAGSWYKTFLAVVVVPIKLAAAWVATLVVNYVIFKVLNVAISICLYPMRSAGKMIYNAALNAFPEEKPHSERSLPEEQEAKEDKEELNQLLLRYLNEIDRLQPRDLFTQYKVALFSNAGLAYYMSPLPFLYVIGQSDSSLEEYRPQMLNQLYLSTVGLCRLDPMRVVLQTSPKRTSPFPHKIALMTVQERLQLLGNQHPQE